MVALFFIPYLILHKIQKREPALQFSPNPFVVQRSERGPSKSGWGDGNPAASDTSQAGLATALGVGGRQAAGLAAGVGSGELGGEFASSSNWGHADVKGSTGPRLS